MACLPVGWDGPVVAYQECPAQLVIVFLLLRLGKITVVDAIIVIFEYSRNIQPVWARHAILAIVAVYEWVISYGIG